MRTKLKRVLLTVHLLIVFGCLQAWAQDQPSQSPANSSRFSHKGLKGAIAFGSIDSEFGEKFDDGGGGLLGIGYGFDDRFTLWLTLLGAEHPSNAVHNKSHFGGIELNLQYRFFHQSRLQPYGKVGAGLYGFEEDGTNTTFAGSGFAIGVGVDWFLSRHFAIGAELMFKELDYSTMIERGDGPDVTTELRPKLDGDAAAFMLGLTIQ
jgi:opacity protein-like surface antigen